LLEFLQAKISEGEEREVEINAFQKNREAEKVEFKYQCASLVCYFSDTAFR